MEIYIWMSSAAVVIGPIGINMLHGMQFDMHACMLSVFCITQFEMLSVLPTSTCCMFSFCYLYYPFGMLHVVCVLYYPL